MPFILNSYNILQCFPALCFILEDISDYLTLLLAILISKGLLVEVTISRSSCSSGISDICSYPFPLETSKGNLEFDRHYASGLKSYKEQKF